MTVEANRRLVERWYQALADGDFETIFAMHHEDVVYNMVGNTPVSGRIYGKEACCNGMITQKLLEKLVPEQMRFARRWTIVAAEGDRVGGLMQGGGPTRDGNDGKIGGMHNSFDTVLVERCLFDNPLRRPEAPLPDPFQIG